MRCHTWLGFVLSAIFPLYQGSKLSEAATPSVRRWQVKENEHGDWEVQVVATKAAESGDEALFLYGARSESSAYFLLHYGFV